MARTFVLPLSHRSRMADHLGDLPARRGRSCPWLPGTQRRLARPRPEAAPSGRRAALCTTQPQALARRVRPPAGPRAARGCLSVATGGLHLGGWCQTRFLDENGSYEE